MTTRVTWALLALLPLAACNTRPPPPMAMPEPAPARVMAPFADGSFGARVAELNRFIVTASQDVARRGSRPAVRSMAAQLVSAHQRDLDGLQQIAVSKGGQLPGALDTRQQTMLGDLTKVRGASLDHDYLFDMINAHQDLVNAYQAEMAEGSDNDFKGFAAANLEPTRQHLARLQRMRPRR